MSARGIPRSGYRILGTKNLNSLSSAKEYPVPRRSPSPFADLNPRIGNPAERFDTKKRSYNTTPNMKQNCVKLMCAGAALFAAISLQAATITITTTINIAAGATYNGNGNSIKAVGMGDGSQDESQKPYFKLNSNSTLKSVSLLAPGVDGCHFYGTGWMSDVLWNDVGEDAWTVKSGGSCHVDYCRMWWASDKIGQVNAASTVDLYYTDSHTGGKVIRQNGGTTFQCTFHYYYGTHDQIHEAIGRTDSSTTRFYYRSMNVTNFSGSNGWWYGRSSQASTF